MPLAIYICNLFIDNVRALAQSLTIPRRRESTPDSVYIKTVFLSD